MQMESFAAARASRVTLLHKQPRLEPFKHRKLIPLAATEGGNERAGGCGRMRADASVPVYPPTGFFAFLPAVNSDI